MVKIDAGRCTGCGWCVDECPTGIIEAGLHAGLPPAVRRQDRCTLCGHCVAICPAGALAHSGLPAGTFDEGGCEITSEAMRDFLLLRRSVRNFTGNEVPVEVMERLIEAGTHAGTASNAQTEGFIIVRDRRLLEELEDMVVQIMWKKLRLLGNPVGRKLAGMLFGEAMVHGPSATTSGSGRRDKRAGRAALSFGTPPP